ncbi:hypothetical protein KFE96_02410 [Kordiimonas sp. SCSIO 12603]|uniref:hypothetical protein n=1 Tax=Kordiimonas sp. SCSIO 12603 TaxID=2829596 RepID=UPI002102EDC5|nr:hypothetical protein [Kordiimonas sp. SCSIO 12603]UTW59181.1 hypothetical protein KFE96_02410 [Kordiimonas sp. SCSIO 12603]
MNKLKTDKHFIRLTIPIIRTHWVYYDPIGVFTDPDSDWPQDEYDGYLGQTYSFLVNQNYAGLEAYVEYVVKDHMGLNYERKRALLFITELKKWWEEYIEEKTSQAKG